MNVAGLPYHNFFGINKPLEKFKNELKSKWQSIIRVKFTIKDSNHIATLTAVVEWYVQKVAGSTTV